MPTAVAIRHTVLALATVGAVLSGAVACSTATDGTPSSGGLSLTAVPGGPALSATPPIVTVPSISIPSFTLPSVSLPSVAIPSVSLPSVSIPSFGRSFGGSGSPAFCAAYGRSSTSYGAGTTGILRRYATLVALAPAEIKPDVTAVRDYYTALSKGNVDRGLASKYVSSLLTIIQYTSQKC